MLQHVRPSRLGLLVAGAAIAAAVLVPTLAMATDDANVLHGCVDPAGALRIVEDGANCTEDERSLDWQIQAPAGLRVALDVDVYNKDVPVFDRTLLATLELNVPEAGTLRFEGSASFGTSDKCRVDLEEGGVDGGFVRVESEGRGSSVPFLGFLEATQGGPLAIDFVARVTGDGEWPTCVPQKIVLTTITYVPVSAYLEHTVTTH